MKKILQRKKSAIILIFLSTYACNESALAPSAQCPNHPEMVLLDNGWCIDRFEASLWENPDCTGKQYGLWGQCDHEALAGMLDDYPEGFPDLVESEDCTGMCEPYIKWNQHIATLPQSTTVYACSIEGIIPSQYMSWFQAKRACENSGKELCSLEVWRHACSKGGRKTYPYGDAYDPKSCNGVEYQNSDAVIKTGSAGECEGGFTGLFDMSGNLAEYLNAFRDGAAEVILAGGYSALSDRQLKCESTITDFPETSLDSCWQHGVRCCFKNAQ